MPNPSAIRRTLSVALTPLLLSVVAAAGVYWSSSTAPVASPTPGQSAGSVSAQSAAPDAATHWSLGVFIGGLLLTTILVPLATVAQDALRDRLLALAMSVTPILALWLIATCQTETLPSEWVGCAAVLITYAATLAGVSAALRTIRLSATVSAALTVMLGLAWLTWPIWLSRTWDGEASAPTVARWSAVHPGLVIQIPNFGAWSEQSIAYHLTDLNQTVSYQTPPSVWRCVIVHGVLGALLLGFATWFPMPCPRRARSVSEDPDAFVPGPDRPSA